VSWDTNGGVNSQYGTDIVVTSILSFDWPTSTITVIS
jgi:hypothetical protein